MDEKFKSWQQQYQKSTPDIDTSALILQISKAQKKEKVTAYSELVLGVVVSIYCIYASIMFAQSTFTIALFAGLSVLPLSFSLWSFKIRQRYWQQQSVDVNQLLAIKQQQLHNQLRYWRINAIVVSLLWFTLLTVAIFDYFFAADGSQLLIVVCVNAFVLLATLARFYYLKAKLRERLNSISNLLNRP